MAKIDILIPVYNEGGNIEKNLDALAAALPKGADEYSVSVVYDFDQDNTLPVLARVKDKYSFPLRLVKNSARGVVNALKTGFASAEGDYVTVTMADMADDYSALPVMVEKAKAGADIVCGSRYMKGGKLNGGPFFKQLMSRLAGVSAYYLTGLPTHDMTNNFKLYRRDLLAKISIESEGGFEIAMELTIKAYLGGRKIAEVPAQWWDRTDGESKFKLMKWLPKYLRWYFYLLRGQYFGGPSRRAIK